MLHILFRFGGEILSNVLGDKRDALIAAGKKGHNVLLFGNKVVGHLTNQFPNITNATVEGFAFPSNYSTLPRLANYTLVILDYAAFIDSGNSYAEQQKLFEKQMIEALDFGTNFCFVHYNEAVPEADLRAFNTGRMNANQFKSLQAQQIGFKCLAPFDIRPTKVEAIIPEGKILRKELKPFLDRWGASHNLFESYGEYKIDDVISIIENVMIAFALRSRKGSLIYLPFQRYDAGHQHFLDGLESLIDCLLTYITKTLTETPVWGHEPFLEEEIELRQECVSLENKLKEAQEKLIPFVESKALLFQSEYILENTVPAFLDQMGVSTFRDERHIEDFWILNDSGEKAVIAEVKSMVKGFKKSAIFSLHIHREENMLDESFPALLVVNCNLQAGSWKDKEKPIDKQDYQVAAQNNILILRVEDLV